MKRVLLTTLFVSIFFYLYPINAENQAISTCLQKKYIDTLLIEGVKIWVRSEPKTGDVIMKLDNGSGCYVLEKGEKQTIRKNTDYWYKIEYEGKEEWGFGSQTSDQLSNYHQQLAFLYDVLISTKLFLLKSF